MGDARIIAVNQGFSIAAWVRIVVSLTHLVSNVLSIATYSGSLPLSGIVEVATGTDKRFLGHHDD